MGDVLGEAVAQSAEQDARNDATRQRVANLHRTVGDDGEEHREPGDGKHQRQQPCQPPERAGEGLDLRRRGQCDHVGRQREAGAEQQRPEGQHRPENQHPRHQRARPGDPKDGVHRRFDGRQQQHRGQRETDDAGPGQLPRLADELVDVGLRLVHRRRQEVVEHEGLDVLLHRLEHRKRRQDGEADGNKRDQRKQRRIAERRRHPEAFVLAEPAPDDSAEGAEIVEARPQFAATARALSPR